MVAPDFDRTTVRIGMAVPIAASIYLAAGSLGIELPGLVAALSGTDEGLTDVLPSLAKMSVALAMQSATAAEIELARHLLLVAIFSSFATLVVQVARVPYATVDIEGFRRRCVGAAHGVGSVKIVVACMSLSLLIGWCVLFLSALARLSRRFTDTSACSR